MSTIHLNRLLNPASIVVVGASDRVGSQGRALTEAVLEGGFQGRVHLINPRHKTLFDRPCLKSLRQLPEAPDLAVLLTPPRTLRRMLTLCAHHDIRVVLVMSATSRSKALHAQARALGIRLLGPYCAGLIRPHLGLNASFSTNHIKPGPLAVVSQSGSLGATLLDWAESAGVGFSCLVSSGADTDISLPDLLDLLSDDHHTRAIIVYLDRLTAPRGFMSAISAASRRKPVVLMRSTQDAAPWCHALLRTGQVLSTEPVFAAALGRAGVVQIRTFSNLFAAAKILSSGLRVKGDRLAIISNGAAPAMLACERITSKGFRRPVMSSELAGKLSQLLPKGPRAINPLVLRDASQTPEHFTEAIRILRESNEFDAILVAFAPDWLNKPLEVARAVIACGTRGKPVLTSWMGDAHMESARELFAEHGVPTFRYPEAAVDGFDFLHRYLVSQQKLLQLPAPSASDTPAHPEQARVRVRQALNHDVRVMPALQARELLRDFGMTALQAQIAREPHEAANMAGHLGFPVAMKLQSPNIAYKQVVVGHHLNIANEAEAREAFEQMRQRLQLLRADAHFEGVLIEPMYLRPTARYLSLSLHRDASFGPVISLGLGGDVANLMSMPAVQLPPLNRFLIEDLLNQKPLADYLGEFRHLPAIDTGALVRALRQFSELICTLPDILSIDIDPLVVDNTTAMALGVHLVLEPRDTPHRYAHLAIHPYPREWVRRRQTRLGQPLTLRPIRPEDAGSIQQLVRGMSAESRYYRFLHTINELSPIMVAQFTKLDYDRQMAFVAELDNGEIVGVSQYTIDSDRQNGEFAVSIADSGKGQGIATQLMQMLIEHGRAQGLEALEGDVLRANRPMQGLMNSMQFQSRSHPDERELLIYRYALGNNRP